jgi:hypothetical protein
VTSSLIIGVEECKVYRESLNKIEQNLM